MVYKNERLAVVWTHTSQLQKKKSLRFLPSHDILLPSIFWISNSFLGPRVTVTQGVGLWHDTPWKTSRFLWMYIIPVLSDRHHRKSRVYDFFLMFKNNPTGCPFCGSHMLTWVNLVSSPESKMSELPEMMETDSSESYTWIGQDKGTSWFIGAFWTLHPEPHKKKIPVLCKTN